jgi:hypothetical protein
MRRRRRSQMRDRIRKNFQIARQLDEMKYYLPHSTSLSICYGLLVHSVAVAVRLLTSKKKNKKQKKMVKYFFFFSKWNRLSGGTKFFENFK